VNVVKLLVLQKKNVLFKGVNGKSVTVQSDFGTIIGVGKSELCFLKV
jgi:uncharacterized protein YoxC